MSVILQFSICQSNDCETLTFTETTGAYDVTSNPNGWGSPNRATSSATIVTLTVTNPDDTEYVLDLSANYPTTDITLEYEINPTEIGLTAGTKIPDGIYKFNYSVTTVVTGTTIVYTQTVYKALYCQVQCCALNMFVGLDVECECSQDSIDKAIKGYALLKGLQMAAECGNITEFNNILAQLEKLCLNNNCNNCK